MHLAPHRSLKLLNSSEMNFCWRNLKACQGSVFLLLPAEACRKQQSVGTCTKDKTQRQLKWIFFPKDILLEKNQNNSPTSHYKVNPYKPPTSVPHNHTSTVRINVQHYSDDTVTVTWGT